MQKYLEYRLKAFFYSCLKVISGFLILMMKVSFKVLSIIL